ncbi:hypothetical protein D9613_003641 [Agrocybe pediades]|uniref:Uncharacterized protein n=1 Tax=Agrocybe pediades TaxID=84607 RepID=A0A8H4QJ46_9AGAR|nr:hypothetical protein D9613_003641 [Agrocybe pediades]
MEGIQPVKLVHVVPKFHLQAHIPKCQSSFSFHFTPKTAHTDGEAPERCWFPSNNLAKSTKRMGPGSRRDTHDDHYGDANFQKIVGLPETFVRKSAEALSARTEHVEAFIEFDAALPVEDTMEWTKMVQAWEEDSTKPNPFELPRGYKVSENDVRLQLAQQDAADLAKGTSVAVHQDISPSVLVSHGLQLQELQIRLASDIQELGPHSTSLQRSKVLERGNALKRRIDAWISVQHLYAPGIAMIRQREDEATTTPVAVPDIPLFLPSFSAETIACSSTLLSREWELRYAQAHERLNTLRGNLLLRAHMYKSKWQHSRGTRMQTRSLSLLSNVDKRIAECTKSYKETYAALSRLAVPLRKVGWQMDLRPLLDSDVVSIADPDETRSEGRRLMSWIWKVHGTGDDATKSTQAVLRIEWCKARARAHRWQEECVLLAEEMRRVLAYSKWEEDEWRSRTIQIRDSVTMTGKMDAISEGKYAYALRQAAIRHEMGLRCVNQWKGLTEKLTTMQDRDAYINVECH